MLICRNTDCAGNGVNSASADEGAIFCGLCGVEMTADA
jgi:hypothetical protein